MEKQQQVLAAKLKNLYKELSLQYSIKRDSIQLSNNHIWVCSFFLFSNQKSRIRSITISEKFLSVKLPDFTHMHLYDFHNSTYSFMHASCPMVTCEEHAHLVVTHPEKTRPLLISILQTEYPRNPANLLATSSPQKHSHPRLEFLCTPQVWKKQSIPREALTSWEDRLE